jgi:hypothetical protein
VGRHHGGCGRTQGIEMREPLGLTDEDLRFVAETVEGGRCDPADAPAALRARPELLDVMLEDDRLVERLLGDEQVLLRVSPRFVFTILLRRVVRDLHSRPYTLERTPAETVAVFDAPRVRRFIAEPAMWNYLVGLLTSFLRNEFVTLLVRRRDRYVRRRFSTSSLEDMLVLAERVDRDEAPWLFRRIADIALFQSGVFPDSLRRAQALGGPAARLRVVPPTLETYEAHGRRFYRLAASQPEAGEEGRVLEALAEEFSTARKSLELLSDRYLRWTRLRWFEAPGG